MVGRAAMRCHMGGTELAGAGWGHRKSGIRIHLRRWDVVGTCRTWGPVGPVSESQWDVRSNHEACCMGCGIHEQYLPKSQDQTRPPNPLMRDDERLSEASVMFSDYQWTTVDQDLNHFRTLFCAAWSDFSPKRGPWQLAGSIWHGFVSSGSDPFFPSFLSQPKATEAFYASR